MPLEKDNDPIQVTQVWPDPPPLTKPPILIPQQVKLPKKGKVHELWYLEFDHWIRSWYGRKEGLPISEKERISSRIDPEYLEDYKKAFRAGWRAAVNVARREVQKDRIKKLTIDVEGEEDGHENI
jgi:hypothetical protein